jgi:short-subunit dehydrogenase
VRARRRRGRRRPQSARGLGLAFRPADAGSPQGVAEIVDSLPHRVDALCNVAGVSGLIGAAKTLAINFYGLRALSQTIAPRLREGGAIVNVASIAG